MKRAMSAWVVAGAVLCAGPAFASPQGQQQQGQMQQQAEAGMQQQRQQRQQQQQQYRQHQLQGTLLRQKAVAVRGTDRRHRVALLETQGGRRVVVDLGPIARGKEAMRLKQGQQLTVTGQFGRVGDRAVLFARSAQVDGQQLRIRRPEQQLMGQRQGREVQGQVVRQKNVSAPGGIEHKVVLLRTQQGLVAVDLGPADQLQEANLQSGQQLAIVARPIIIGDRMVLWADQISTDEGMMQIRRPQQAGMGGAGAQDQDEELQ